MRAVIQRVSGASVTVDGSVVGAIKAGFVVFLGVSGTDTPLIAEKMAEKIAKLRVFEDKDGKTNLSSADINAEILVISQFTLYADCRKGNRPSFTLAGPPDLAKELYFHFISSCKGLFSHVQSGVFGAHMTVSLDNDGPFTVILDNDTA
ncbi:MAG: D-tyrosyl-tRNA(Tyr) deacylase [Clostridiales bacterium]|jgi:D-tyrosyl-tRNA(Tyr) deacylase|nr:D-tyrosyl-tRNA(Tyr) deacylase [Clostridiales bacterium]